jgi:hypothetical protein
MIMYFYNNNNNNNNNKLQLGFHPLAEDKIATKFTSEGPHEKHVVATWNLGNHLSICF